MSENTNLGCRHARVEKVDTWTSSHHVCLDCGMTATFGNEKPGADFRELTLSLRVNDRTSSTANGFDILVNGVEWHINVPAHKVRLKVDSLLASHGFVPVR